MGDMPDHERLPQAKSFQSRLAEWDNECYRIGAEYESKGRIGRLIMRLVYRGSPALESGRASYSRHHYQEAVTRAYNEEVTASW